MLGHTEILVIVLVILVLFGAAAIPKFARSLGQAKKEFTQAMKEGEEDEKKDRDEDKTKKKA
ncbi:MAG: twin-arginine translocase TatA/TatE family subunit [Treponema sp.]|jgi:sec-independent protein translocase protein TatA|nr:twin-arginine translocase TatA/TatE family subunit [Treponema sp.]